MATQKEGAMKSSTAPEPLLLSATEAARMLSISPRTLWTMTATGEMPCVRIRGRVLYDMHDLRTYIETNKERERQR